VQAVYITFLFLHLEIRLAQKGQQRSSHADAAVMAVFWYGFGVRTRFAGLPEVKNETKVEVDVVNT
jgi:hypothetical protein